MSPLPENNERMFIFISDRDMTGILALNAEM